MRASNCRGAIGVEGPWSRTKIGRRAASLHPLPSPS
uniref:Uncharacterized protein n=1 Tax=Arundo donax TaxID=35708 RepID=A0A0A8YVE7_ARUDO